MKDFIVIAIIALLVASGIFSAIRHFKGQGGCCGGGAYRVKRKKLSRVRYQKVFGIDGVHCKQCKSKAEEAVNDITGISGRVDIRKRVLTVSYEDDVDDEVIRLKLKKRGYTLGEMKK